MEGQIWSGNVGQGRDGWWFLESPGSRLVPGLLLLGHPFGLGGTDFPGAGLQEFGFAGAAHLPQRGGIVFRGRRELELLGGEGPFSDGQGSLIERLRFGVLPLVAIDTRQIIQRQGEIGVIRPQGLCLDVARPPQQRLGFGVAAPGTVDQDQDGEALEDGLRFDSRMFLADRQGPLRERLGLVVSPLVVEHPNQIADGSSPPSLRHLGFLRSRRLSG